MRSTSSRCLWGENETREWLKVGKENCPRFVRNSYQTQIEYDSTKWRVYRLMIYGQTKTSVCNRNCNCGFKVLLWPLLLTTSQVSSVVIGSLVVGGSAAKFSLNNSSCQYGLLTIKIPTCQLGIHLLLSHFSTTLSLLSSRDSITISLSPSSSELRTFPSLMRFQLLQTPLDLSQ